MSRLIKILALYVLTLCVLVAVAFPSLAHAADAQITVRVAVVPSQLASEERGVLSVEIDIPTGWHLMGLDPGPGPQPLRMKLSPGAGLKWVEPWHGEQPEEKFDRGFGRLIQSYEQPTVHFRRLVQAISAADSKGGVRLDIRAQICTDKQCIPQRQSVPVAYNFAEAATGAVPLPIPFPLLKSAATGGVAVAAVSSSRVTAADPVPPGKAIVGTGSANSSGGIVKELDQARKRGVLVFMAMAFVFGLGALATPCVFPAIPLTISFFSKYSAESFGRGARLAFVYAGTMVAAFTFLGVMLSVIFGVTGVQQFASHPIFNFVLGAVLVYFSLNLLGLFELSTPDFLLTAVNRLENDFGAAPGQTTSDKQGSLRDYLVVAIAAVSATTVFFTCTVAFVGLVLVAAANGEWFWPTLGMLSFASAFALPFFLLALFPQAAKRLQGKAGSWLSATRVTLGFLELAAATKFFSNSDLVWDLGLISRDFVLTLWVPLFFLCGLFLLGKLQVGEETTAGHDGRTGVVQMLSALVMFAISLNLAVGLFNNRVFGGWVDGWLPPLERSAAAAGSNSDATFNWLYSLKEGRAQAQREGKLVFVNYTGYTCTNCRYMEGGVFPDPRIAPLLDKMVLVELYTDNGSADNDANRDDQVKRFATAALPLYSVETANGVVLGSFPSSTNDVGEFETFLIEARARVVAAQVAAEAKPSQPPSVSLLLKTTALFGGEPRVALPEGKWTLLNFWATWCSPCREELEAFLIAEGAQFVARGGAFQLVAVEEEENRGLAQKYVKSLGFPEAAALRISGDPTNEDVDPRFGFTGTLPFTALVSPAGEVVWSHTNTLTREQLRSALSQAKLP